MNKIILNWLDLLVFVLYSVLGTIAVAAITVVAKVYWSTIQYVWGLW